MPGVFPARVFIPGIDQDGRLFKHLFLRFTQMLLLDDGFVAIGAEIRLRADEVAFLADIFAPGILDFPAVGLAISVEIHAREQHGVVRCKAAVLETGACRRQVAVAVV